MFLWADIHVQVRISIILIFHYELRKRKLWKVDVNLLTRIVKAKYKFHISQNDDVSIGKWSLTVRRIILPPTSRLRSPIILDK